MLCMALQIELDLKMVLPYAIVLKTKQHPQKFYITGRSKAILLLWFNLFNVLELNFSAA